MDQDERVVDRTIGDLGWTAGILDGEGYFGMAKAPNYGVKVSVGNTDMRMLQHLQHLWGGKIYANRHDYANSKPFWSWQLHGKDVFRLIREVLPYMVNKREQAEIVLEVEPLHGKKNSYDKDLRDSWRAQREAICQRLRHLTQRGAVVKT